MFKKTTLAVIVAVLSGSAYSIIPDINDSPRAGAISNQQTKLIKVDKYQQPAFLQKRPFVFDNTTTDSRQVYIIHLNDAPVALYQGGNRGMPSTAPNGKKLNLASSTVRNYTQYIENKQLNFVSDAQKEVPAFKPLLTYKLAFNGMAAALTQEEAARIANLPYVLSVEKDPIFKIDTDTGPGLIGAPRVWSGDAQSSGIGNYGEGVVVGIIDSGINTDHPSFADIASDGFDHTNPLGSGNYLGDCAGDYPELCNDKLIGVYSYPVITNTYTDTDVFPPGLAPNGEDYGGHGTHVAGTAAGNILLNAPESLPEFGAEESSGIVSGFIFDRVSGVAPRANIISYQVCWGGRSDAGDTYGDCTGSAINAAIEDAIEDQVDVINYSISGGGQPWSRTTELAFLSARNAGIFVATSAGNSGPDAGSTSKHAPWYTAVAAAEHGRNISYAKTIGNFNGGSFGLNNISGVSNSGGITAPIVYAGDFTNPNDPGGDPAQCLQPFPSGTFNGQIVVCDRGEIARVQKAVNVRDGGAGGYVLANVSGGTNNIVADVYVIPGIHISASNGSLLRSWLASGANHSATISATSGELVINPNRQDVLASFSSKGPNGSISTLTPTIGGPGVRIYAAYADQQFGHDGHEPSAGDYNYLSGTSMSSPHVAGAAALVKAVNPEWTPDNIRSALAMTASRTVKKEDGTTSADWFDSGSGRVQVDLAIEAGLVMDETASNYTAANPLIGGDPRELNLPSITDNECARSCSWERTFTATKDGSWQVETEVITNGMTISVSPSAFTLTQGQTQTLTVSMNVANASSADWHFGAINMRSNGQPDLHLPISVIPVAGDIPEELTVNSSRSADSLLLEDLESLSQSNFTATSLGFAKATEISAALAQDSTPNSVFDNLSDGIDLIEVNISDNSQQLVANILESSAPDIDLYLIFDENNNNQPEENEVLEQSTTSGSLESIDIKNPASGRYWLLVQNYASSSAGAEDDYVLSYANVANNDSDISISAEVPSSISSGSPFDMRLNWDLGNALPSERYYGVIGFGSNANPTAIQTSYVQIIRRVNDVQLSARENVISVGEASEFVISIAATESPEDRNYDITLPIPSGFSLVNSSIEQGGAINGETVSWNVTRTSSASDNQELTFQLIPQATISESDFLFSVSSDVTNISAAQVESSTLSTELQLDLPPIVQIDGEDSVSLSIFETQSATITASASDPNGEEVSVQWQQISGPDMTLTGSNTETLSFTAPSVDSEQSAVLQITVFDGRGNTDTATATVVINNNQAPTLDITAPSSVVVGNSYTISVNASDPEGDNVNVSIAGVPGNSLTRTAPANQTTLSINIEANDGINTVNETVSITVNAAPTSGGNAGDSGGESGGGGSAGWLVFCLLPFIWFRRKKNDL